MRKSHSLTPLSSPAAPGDWHRPDVHSKPGLQGLLALHSTAWQVPPSVQAPDGQSPASAHGKIVHDPDWQMPPPTGQSASSAQAGADLEAPQPESARSATSANDE